MKQVAILTLKNTAQFMHDQGADQDTIQKALAKTSSGFDNPYSFGEQALNWATLVLKDALVAVILAAIFKKNKPEDLSQLTETNTIAS